MSSPGPLSPQQQAAMAKSQKEARDISLWAVGIFCIYCWDYVVCFPKEVKYIWRQKFSYISWLYIADRYFGLVQGAVSIWIMDVTNTGPQAKTCQKIYLWQPVGAFILTFLSHSIMTSRVYALYSLSKTVLGVLITIMAAEFAVQVYTITVTFPAPPPGPNIPIPCVSIGPTQWLVAFWSMPLVFDSVTFLLTLFKTYTFWRRQMRAPTINLIFRDGLIYFAAIFSMNLVNVILFTTQGPGLKGVNLPATVRMNIIMACRMILNLRKPRAGIHMSGTSGFGGERQVSLWNSPSKPESNTHELSSTVPTSVGVAIATKVDTRV